MARVKLKSDAALAKYEADLSAAKLKYQVEKSTYDKIQRQIEVCTIRAPRDGMVVYVNQRAGGFRGGREPRIYGGGTVTESPRVDNLPGVQTMQANRPIHE